MPASYAATVIWLSARSIIAWLNTWNRSPVPSHFSSGFVLIIVAPIVAVSYFGLDFIIRLALPGFNGRTWDLIIS